MPLKKSIKKHVCRSDNCSYLISCKVCWKQYVGEKSDLRKSNHNLTIKIKKKKDFDAGIEHFISTYVQAPIYN